MQPNLAHEAIHIVLEHHKGKLESFETDTVGRLMAADRICRHLTGCMLMALRNRTAEEREEVDTLLAPIKRRSIEQWRKLVPEYVPIAMRTGLLTDKHRIGEIVTAFREAIRCRLRESIFDRLGRAQRLLAAYYAQIMTGFAMVRKPTIDVMQRMNFLHTPDGLLALGPLRLALVDKIRQLAPELGDAEQVTTIENSYALLVDLADKLEERAGDADHMYGDMILSRLMEQTAAEEDEDDQSDEAEDSHGSTEEDDPSTSGSVRIIPYVHRTILARPLR